MGRVATNMPEPGTQAERMRRLRLATGCKTQTEFAKRFGFTVTQWSNFENGSPVGANAAKRLVEKIPGITLDWIYNGSAAFLTMEMARKLGELPDDSG